MDVQGFVIKKIIIYSTPHPFPSRLVIVLNI